MKTSISIILLSISVLLTFNACTNPAPKSTAVEQVTAKTEIYTCSMHPEVRSDKPGDCPKCGMKLIVLETADTSHLKSPGDSTLMK